MKYTRIFAAGTKKVPKFWSKGRMSRLPLNFAIMRGEPLNVATRGANSPKFRLRWIFRGFR